MRTIIKENKLTATIVGFLLVSILGWGTWVTHQVFAEDKNRAVNESERKVVAQAIDEIKTDLKEIKKETKEDLQKLDDQIAINQQKTMEILLDLKKSSKINGEKRIVKK